jgi:adenylosuccinate lyase
VIFPDSTLALDFMLNDLTWVLEGLRVYPERMRENLDFGGGLAYSQTVLLALIDKGFSREDAYGIVQGAAAAAWDAGVSFRETIAADPRVTMLLTPTEIEALFDPSRFLHNLDVVFDRLSKLPVSEDV